VTIDIQGDGWLGVTQLVLDDNDWDVVIELQQAAIKMNTKY
jgi:hypothetical protein